MEIKFICWNQDQSVIRWDDDMLGEVLCRLYTFILCKNYQKSYPSSALFICSKVGTQKL